MKYFLLYVLSMFTVLNCFGQDPIFSQYYTTPMYVNPAFAADKQNINFSINNRTYTSKQFDNYNLAQVTAIVPFSLDFLYKSSSSLNHYSGTGISVYQESTGAHNELNSFGALMTFAHSIQLYQQHYLALGLQGGYMRRVLGSEFDWGSQYSIDFGYDPSIVPSIDLADDFTQFATFGAGLQYFYTSSSVQEQFKQYGFDAYAGVSFFNVNRPDQSFFEDTETRLPMAMKVNAGIKYNAAKRLTITPTALWVRQNELNQINTGLYANIVTGDAKTVTKKNVIIIVGTWYRFGDSFITTLGCALYDFKLALSYDFNASNFEYNNKGRGAAEISLKYTLPNKDGEDYSRGLLYPSF
ncbi:MAG: PorP/SprF family type IX secretion system membrane protein [Bacteroidales bacterium]